MKERIYVLKSWYPSLPADWEPGMLLTKIKDECIVDHQCTEFYVSDEELAHSDFWEPLNKVLLTTLDGFDILENESYIILYKDFTYSVVVAKKNDNMGFLKNEDIKIFKQFKNVHNYKLWNMPLFSLTEIKEFSFEELEKMGSSRINEK